MGFDIHWTRTGCTVRHPKHGRIQTWLRICPVMKAEHVLLLIKELEDHERKKVSDVDGSLLPEERSWWKTKFPEVPDQVWDYMTGQGEDPSEYRDGLPWNRHKRRRVAKARGVVVHLFSGRLSREWQDWNPGNGIEVLTLDMEQGADQNLHSAAVWAYLWNLAVNQKILAIIGGPPCRTVSRLLERSPGPPRLRGRVFERFGYQDLGEMGKQKANNDIALFLKQVGLFLKCEECRTIRSTPTGFLLESPMDPAHYDERANDSASFWAWPETQQVLQDHAHQGMSLIEFDQGALQHPRRKPTGILTNLKELYQLQGLRSDIIGEALPEELAERLQVTSSWSTWAPRLREVIRMALKVHMDQETKGNAKLAKVSDDHQWQEHLRQDHVPFRNDCRICLEQMGRGLPHRRRHQAGSAAYAMSVDLAGPFKKAADTMTKTQCKYAFVATLTVPDFGTAMEEKEVKKPMDDVVNADWGEDEDAPVEPEDEEILPGLDDDSEEVDEPKIDPKLVEKLNKEAHEKIKAKITEMKQPYKMRHITMVEPIASRKIQDVLGALGKCYARFRLLGAPIYRLHMDKAREFISAPVRRWASQRDLVHTITSGDDPQGNGRVENEIQQLRRRTRLLLHVVGLDALHWPAAMRHSAEGRFRKQLQELGVNTHPMLQFGKTACVKAKSWDHRYEDWRPSCVTGIIYGPSPTMNHGWVLRTAEGRCIHVRTALVPDKNMDKVRLELEEGQKEPLELEDPAGDPPRRRLHGKTRVEGQLRLPPPPPVLEDHEQDDYTPSIAPAGERPDPLEGFEAIERGEPPSLSRLQHEEGQNAVPGEQVKLKERFLKGCFCRDREEVEKMEHDFHVNLLQLVKEELRLVETDGDVAKVNAEMLQELISRRHEVEENLEVIRGSRQQKVQLRALQEKV